MRALAASTLALLLAACGGARLSARDASSREIAPPSEGRARVVLAVPGGLRDVITLVDERGRYLGQLSGRTFTTLEVEPGARRFYALVDASAYVVGGTVEAGRTYWVLGETHGFGRPLRWVAWSPSCDENASARVERARAVERDPAADERAIERQLGNVPQRILEADEELQEMSETERALRELRAACAPEPATSQPATSAE